MRVVLAAATAALVFGAQAQASTVVWQESGTLGQTDCYGDLGCVYAGFNVGGGSNGFLPIDGLFHTVLTDYVGPGSYIWRLDLDMSKLLLTEVVMSTWESYSETFPDGVSWGDEINVPNASAHYTLDADGISGSFTVPDMIAYDLLWPTDSTGQGGPTPLHHVEHFFTDAEVYGYALEGAGGTPYSFRVTRLDPPGSVPEPASWALMIGGLGLVGSFLRRRSVARA